MSDDAKKVYNQLSDTAKKEHSVAWSRVEAHVTKLANTPKAKVFEVHHAIEYARELYHAELSKGLPADLCEKAVMQAYKE